MTRALPRPEQFFAAHEDCGGEISIRATAGVIIEATCSGCWKMLSDDTPRFALVDALPAAEIERICRGSVRQYDVTLQFLGVVREQLEYAIRVGSPRLNEAGRERVGEQIRHNYRTHRRLLLSIMAEAAKVLGADVFLNGAPDTTG
jgi:hypothetical protein